MPRDIQLDGAEISIIKALGFGGEVDGQTLMDRCADLEFSVLMDAVKGLMSVGFVEADGFSLHNQEDVAKTHFHVNSGYSKELQGAVDPDDEPKKSKRVRRE
jgi:hypothetical protein